jgi:hypothetical protein
MIKITNYYNEIRLGSSLPWIVGGNDSNRYVVKLNGSGDGIIANAIDWVSIKLGRLMHIPVLDPEFLEISSSFIKKNQDPEIIELIEKSVGLNFGTRFKDKTSIYCENSEWNFNEKLKNDIFLYDLFLLNIDRSAKNPNIIYRNHKLWCLDFSSSITMRSSIDGKSYQERLLLPHLKKHPFYHQSITAKDFIKRLKSIRDEDIFDILEEMPDEWLQQIDSERDSSALRILIGNRLIEKIDKAKTLSDRLKDLKYLKTETEKERRAIALNNRNAFHKKHGLS